MKHTCIYIFLILSMCSLFAQDPYRSVDQIQEEWQDYADFQKQELVSFSNFLMDEGFYERALLGYFRYLYKYPDDSLKYNAYFQIAKAYELMGKADLSLQYYERIVNEADSSALSAQAANRQIIYLLYTKGEIDEVFRRTNSDDPYQLVLRGYAHLQRLQWTEARQSFKTAEVLFDHSHYSKLLRPLYKAIEAAENAPLKKKRLAILSALVPGGGHLYLKQYENALGSAFSSILLYSAIFSIPSMQQSNSIIFQENRQRLFPMTNNLNRGVNTQSRSAQYQAPADLNLKSSRKKVFLVPISILIGLYAGSIWKTIDDIDSANRRLVERFVGRVSERYPLDRFLDYKTPEFYLK